MLNGQTGKESGMKADGCRGWDGGLDLLIVLAITLLAALLVPATHGIIRAVLGALFVFFIPGYALVCAVFPASGSVGGIERFGLSVGASIVCVTLLGIMLNFTPWGISLWPLSMAILVFVSIVVLVAWLRRRRVAPDGRFSLLREAGSLKVAVKAGVWEHKYRFAALAVAVVIAAGGLAAVVAVVSDPSAGLESGEFYLLPGPGHGQDYPGTVRVNEEVSLRVVVVNRQPGPVDYTIRVALQGEPLAEYAGIRPGEKGKWEGEVAVTPRRAGQHQKLEYRLFRDGQAIEGSVLYIWIDVEA